MVDWPVTTGSVEALQVRFTAEVVTLDTWRLAGAGGGVESVWVLLTVTATAADVEVLPAPSVAAAVREWVPFETPVVSHVPVYGAVVRYPFAMLLPSTLSSTEEMPDVTAPLTVGSEALTAMATALPETVEPPRGEEMETVGEVWSGVVADEVVNVASADLFVLPEASVEFAW